VIATLPIVFKQLDVAGFEARLSTWAEQALAAQPGTGAQLEATACDGKTLRGSRELGAPGSYLLAAVSQRLGLTLPQCVVAAKTNELSAICAILTGLLLTRRVITTDALHTQRAFAQAVLDAGGDYLCLSRPINRSCAKISPPCFRHRRWLRKCTQRRARSVPVMATLRSDT
jgi:hypothetical protein